MVQYKLCTKYNDSPADLLEHLNQVFGEKYVTKINNTCLAIEYNYNDMDYKVLLSHIVELQIGQRIVTSDIMFFLLKKFLENYIVLKEIKFIDTVNADDNKLIEKYIRNLYITKETEEYENAKNLFLQELEWIVSDESIDIISITLNINKGKKNHEVQIFNNGVVLCSSAEISKEVFEIIGTVLVVN